ncbi:hypothetical protein [Parvularcula maris]|uniref:Uncharacterized protein n=1 Tax=Parvularcula maris TaxID=2965077 RepID=A0A9X2L794_9PROT|nr:hypothetical protein [Parvularcula maris]MCQ8184332.1 hypothetical protein [Parvularcula maris]
MGTAGNILRGLVLAVLIGIAALLVGAGVALFGCASGCGFAEPGASFVRSELGLFGGVEMAFVLGGFLLLGLLITLVPRDPVAVFAALFAIGLAAVSFFYFLPAGEPAEPTEVVVTDPVLPPRPEDTGLIADPVLPERCRDGQFLEGGVCTSCTVERVVTAEPKLRFRSVDTGANWVYAERRLVEAGSGEESVNSYIERLAERSSFCSAEALLVYGSASSDGMRPLNEERARARAANLAEAVRRACTGRSSGLTIYALSLGQSEAPSDVPEDRPVSISVIENLSGEELSSELVLEELEHAVAEGQNPAAILSRRDRFPQPWTGPRGTRDAFDAVPRPERRVRTLVPGAPPSCRTSDGGLDDGTSLRQVPGSRR